MKFHCNLCNSAKGFWFDFPCCSQSLDALIFITWIFTTGRLGCSLLSLSSLKLWISYQGCAPRLLVPVPWLEQGREEPGFVFQHALDLSFPASHSWLQCNFFHTDVKFWDAQHHSPWCNGRVFFKNGSCGPTKSTQQVCALTCPCSGAAASPEEQGADHHVSMVSSARQRLRAISGHWEQKEAPVLPRKGAVLLELCFLLPRTSSTQKWPVVSIGENLYVQKWWRNEVNNVSVLRNLGLCWE